MKKIALVAALAAVTAAPAFAQSSVTLWGRINTSVESQKFGNQDRKSLWRTTVPVWACVAWKTWAAA